MATFSITALPPNNQANVKANVSGPLTSTISWDIQPLTDLVEVARATTANLSNAIIIGQTLDSLYIDANLTLPGNYYYWTRRKNEYGTVGNWDFSANTGSLVNVSGVNTQNITSGAITNTTLITDSSITNLTVDWGQYQLLSNILIVGTGSTFTIASDENLSTGFFLDTAAGAENVYLTYDYKLANLSAGGSDTSSGNVTHNSTSVAEFGNSITANLTNLTSGDNVYATVSVGSSGTMDDFCLYNFGFANTIPSGATLIDVEVNFKANTSSNIGTPAIRTSLCWDGNNFSVTDGAILSGLAFLRSVTTTQTNHRIGGNTYVTGSWGSYPVPGQLSRDITMADIKDSNFGISVLNLSNGASINSKFYYDYFAVNIYYSTKEYPINVQKQVIIGSPQFDTTLPATNSYATVLSAGCNYRYNIKMIKTYVGTLGSTTLAASTSNRITTIQEFKR